MLASFEDFVPSVVETLYTLSRDNLISVLILVDATLKSNLHRARKFKQSLKILAIISAKCETDNGFYSTISVRYYPTDSSVDMETTRKSAVPCKGH